MLKRHTPLKRKTPIARSKTRIKPVSTKRAAQLREYKTLREQFLRAHPICQVWLAEHGWTEAAVPGVYNVSVETFRTCAALEKVQGTTGDLQEWFSAPLSTEIHHTNKRRGAMLNQTQYWLAVCRENHERIENSKAWARANGFLLNF